MSQVTLNRKDFGTKNPIFWATAQYIGLVTAGVPAKIRKKSRGGICTLQMDGSPFTGPIVLSVRKGGLRNQETPADANELFKKEVMPVLVRIGLAVDLQCTGKYELYFQDSELTAVKN